MPGYETDPPELVPVLSPGKHRNPRRGACFMDLASYLAGERWSDHPPCTHPLLAALARDVNDYTSDAGRSQLAVLIPSVIGLTGDQLRIDARIALACARLALPVVAAGRQRVLAVSVLVGERVLAGLDGRPAGGLTEPSRAALARVPDAAQWARVFSRDRPVTARDFRRRAAPCTVRTAAQGVAQACIPQPDQMLRDLLIGAIDECTAEVALCTGPGAGHDRRRAVWQGGAGYQMRTRAAGSSQSSSVAPTPNAA